MGTGIAAEDVDFLRGHDPDMTLLKIYQGYTGLKKRRELLTWQIRNDASNDVLPILQHMTPHKAMRYLDAQFGFLRFRNLLQQYQVSGVCGAGIHSGSYLYIRKTGLHRDAESGQVQIESYYYTYHSGILTDWKEGPNRHRVRLCRPFYSYRKSSQA